MRRTLLTIALLSACGVPAEPYPSETSEDGSGDEETETSLPEPCDTSDGSEGGSGSSEGGESDTTAETSGGDPGPEPEACDLDAWECHRVARQSEWHCVANCTDCQCEAECRAEYVSHMVAECLPLDCGGELADFAEFDKFACLEPLPEPLTCDSWADYASEALGSCGLYL